MNSYIFSALVIDDKFDEIKGFMNVLNHNGIATYYLNFVDDKNKIENYIKNISNIRLIVTDLFEDNAQTQFEKVVSVFDNLQDNKINNFILIVWTKHKEKYDEFIEHLEKYQSDLNFISVCLSKENFIDVSEGKFLDEKYEDFSKEVKKYLENNFFKYFLEWETNINQKSVETVNEILTSLKEDDLKSIIATLTQEEKDESLKQKELFKVLNTILNDKIVSIDIKNNIEGISFDDNIDEELKARLNTSILFETNPANKINNGNIYLYSDFTNKLNEEEKKSFSNLICYEFDKKFTKEFYLHQSEKLGEDDNIILTCNTIREEGVSKSKFDKQCKNYHKENILPILIDITPSCDIANSGKLTKNRLLFGYIYKSELKCFKKAEYLYNPNFTFTYNNINYKIILSLKELFSINPNYLNNLKPILRARKELSANIQQKVASHIARVGVFSLEDKH